MERAAAALDALPAHKFSSDDLATAGAGELLVSRALLALQRSCTDEALELLGDMRRATGERADVGYGGAVTALALAAAGRLTTPWPPPHGRGRRALDLPRPAVGRVGCGRRGRPHR